MPRGVLLLSICLATSLASFGASSGQDSPPASSSRTDPPAQRERNKSDDASATRDGGILGGPEVIEDARGGSPFDRRGDRRPQEPPIPPERWLRMLFAFELSEDQRGNLQRLLADFRDRQAAFREEHGERLRRLDRLRREAEQSRRPLDPDLVAESQRLMSAMPRLESVQEQAWKLLTEEQQSRFKTMLAEEAARVMAERAARERGSRAGGQAMQGDQPMRGETMQSDPTMRNAGEPMAPGQPARQPAAPDVRRPGSENSGLDEAGERRLRFLRSRQKSRQPGLPPEREDFEFRFDDRSDR